MFETMLIEVWISNTSAAVLLNHILSPVRVEMISPLTLSSEDTLLYALSVQIHSLIKIRPPLYKRHFPMVA